MQRSFESQGVNRETQVFMQIVRRDKVSCVDTNQLIRSATIKLSPHVADRVVCRAAVEISAIMPIEEKERGGQAPPRGFARRLEEEYIAC